MSAGNLPGLRAGDAPIGERWSTALQPERSSVHVDVEGAGSVAAQLDVVLHAVEAVGRADHVRVVVGVPTDAAPYVGLLDGAPADVLAILDELPPGAGSDWQDWDYGLGCWSYREDAPYAERREAVMSLG